MCWPADGQGVSRPIAQSRYQGSRRVRYGGLSYPAGRAIRAFNRRLIAQLLFVLAGTTAASVAASADTAASAVRYNPLQTFAPLTLPEPVSRYRSSNGAPGPDYWQNRADYDLHAKLDTTRKVLSATQVITYTNHSPDTL